MSARATQKPGVVARCAPTQGGSWLVLTKDGRSAVSTCEIPIGQHVKIIDGRVERHAP